MEPPSEKHTDYSLRKSGRPYSKGYRVYFERRRDGIPISPFHDIPLYRDEDKRVLNMVVEVPRWSQAKFEISRSNSLNPIIQDTLGGKPRFVKSCFPYKGYIWNYGALPQTWEDPNTKTPEAGNTKGDNDPLDACEIGSRVPTETGTLKQVKVLGILGLIDSGETDWKVIVIDIRDPLAKTLDDIEDVERYMPGLLDATRDWFRVYKVPDGKEPNEFAFEGKFMDKKYANKVIDGCAEAWRKLVTGEVDKGDVSIENTTLRGTSGKVDPDEVDIPPEEDLSPAPIEQDLDEWVYLNRDELELVEGSLEGSSLCITLELKQ